MYLSAWNKLIFLLIGVLILILLNKNLNLDSFFGLKKEINNTNSFIETPTPTKEFVSPTPSLSPSTIQTPTPTIIKSIQRIRNQGFENDN